MKVENPLTQTPEWKALVSKYIRMMKKYQSGPAWCFDHIETGIDWNDETGRFDKLMSIETLRGMVKRVSPIGPEVPIDDIVDITPTWEWLCENCKSDKNRHYDYDKYMKWVDEQTDAFYYARGKEDFYKWKAFEIASKLGYKKVIMENMS